MLPVDYKLFRFLAERLVSYRFHLDRAGNHRWIVFDRRWKRVSPATPDPDPPQPTTLRQMITAAELLGAGLSFVRADFYEVDRQPIFGELTFYPGSGLERVEPLRLDLEMGRLWTAAAAAWTEDALRLTA